MKKIDNYYMGLDIGTNSVGWALTDTNYNLLRLKGKNAWGVRLFDEANTAAERRTFRSNRRRKKRTEWRLELIKQLFENEINKIDDSFYIRMKNSPLFMEDKDLKIKYVLFNDKGFTDIDYFKKYPTIYHLRKELMTSKEPHDVRLVFLAVYHIVKHRGHFLWNNIDINSIDSNFDSSLESLITNINEIYNIDLSIIINELKEILLSNIKTKNDKKVSVRELLKINIENKKIFNNISKLFELIISSTSDAKHFKDDDVELENDKNSENSYKLEFESEQYEEQIINLSDFLKEDVIELILCAKGVYDSIKLNKIMGGEKSISQSKILAYNKHKEDLRELKDIIKKYTPNKYNEIFRDNNENNYVAYCGKNIISGSKKYMKQCGNPKKFYDYIWKILKNIDDDRIKRIGDDIDNNNYLPLLRWRENSIFPIQLHEIELQEILNNAKNYLDFLNVTDNDGKSVCDKILSTFNFRVPYYIGPLNDYHKESSKNHNVKGAWLTFKENKGKLYPWNYLESIDTDKTEEDFIIRMTNKCTYLPDKDVLPKNSLLYQEFMVLNEINVIRINNKKLSLEEKKVVFELFKKRKKVTLKMIIDSLIADGIYGIGELTKDNISGIDKNKDIKSSLSSYHKFKEFFGDNIKNDSVKAIIELIIRYLTIYSGDGDKIKKRIEREKGPELKQILINYESDLNKICKLKFSGWGNLSSEFLCLEGIEKETGCKNTVINFLREKSLNIMELIATEDYTFNEYIKEYNQKEIDTIKYDLVDDLYVSPSVKRAIWQALRIVDELVSIIGKHPQKVFIEMARSDEEKVETETRKNMLSKLYESIDDAEYIDIKNQLKNETNITLRKKDLFLYYTQLGKDMYTGKQIDLSELHNNKLYDIDHIYPRSKTGQDSLMKNLVLVNKNDNLRKSDDYPLPKDIQNKMKSFWLVLKQKKLISDEKYNRLIRNTELTNDELAGFIDRQLVETRQSTKVVKDILSDCFNNETRIIPVHANLVSKFRNGENMKKDSHGKTIKYLDFPKVRCINDFHHAKDAYLNIVVGNVYNTKFTDNPKHWLKDNVENKKMYNLNWMYSKDINNAWFCGENGTIKTVEKVMSKNDVIVTVQKYEKKGELFDQTIEPSIKNYNKSKAKVGLKDDKQFGNIEKYGGYTSVNPSYFVIYKYDEEKTTKKVENNISNVSRYDIKTINIIDILKIRNNKDYLKAKNKKKYEISMIENLLIEELKLSNKDVIIKNLKIIKNRLLINTVISLDNYKYYLRGSKDFGSAEQLILSNFSERYIKRISKYINVIENIQLKKEMIDSNNIIDISKKYFVNVLDNIKVYDEILHKYKTTVFSRRIASLSDKLEEKRDKFTKLNVFEQSKVIIEILKNFTCKVTQRSNLSLLDLSNDEGRLTKTINLNKNRIIIYDYSITGLYCHKEYIDGVANNKNKQ